MKTLECSSKGDRRFSAFYAKVKCRDNSFRSIESMYQNAKRTPDGSVAGKGKRPAYAQIGSKRYKLTALTPFYNWLWLKYFEQNPELLKVIAEYDVFTDMFRGHCINCQADVVQLVHDKGIEALREVSDFSNLEEKII